MKRAFRILVIAMLISMLCLVGTASAMMISDPAVIDLLDRTNKLTTYQQLMVITCASHEFYANIYSNNPGYDDMVDSFVKDLNKLDNNDKMMVIGNLSSVAMNSVHSLKIDNGADSANGGSLETDRMPEAKKVVSEVLPISARIVVNEYGTPELYASFKNESSSVIVDRVDFAIRCYNAYGDEIQQYGIYSNIEAYYEGNISKGSSSDSTTYWRLSGMDGARTVEIAVIKYHKTNGDIVEIPESDRDWIKFD